MTEPEEVTDARKHWRETVAKLTPAARDGLIQSIMDSADVLGLVVVPQDRVRRLVVNFEDLDGLNLVMAAQEIKARQMIQAAQGLAQHALEAEVVGINSVRRLGKRVTRYELLAIAPAENVKSGDSASPELLSSESQAT